MARSTEDPVQDTNALSRTDGLIEAEGLATGAQGTQITAEHEQTPRQPAAARASQARAKVIKFSNVSKRFTLRHERPNSFQDMVVSLFGLRSPSRLGKPMPRPAVWKRSRKASR